MSDPRHPVLVFAALILFACANSPVKLVGGTQALKELSPWYRQALTVAELTTVHGFLLADLTGQSSAMHSYFADNDACRGMLKKGATLQSQGGERLGQLSSATGTCQVTGTRDLVTFRDAQYSGDPEESNAGANAVFRTLYTDEEIWLRGQFPWVGNLGFIADDAILIVPATDACRKATAQGTALMYFYSLGSRVFVLAAGGTRCSAVAVIQPS